MTTLQGIARHAGVVIAIPAVVDARHGINGVSPTLLQSGITALRRGMQPEDYPEAIVVCDSLAMGAGVRIPGVQIIGLAVESGSDVPGLQVDVPCVIGTPDLIRSVSEGNVLIVDGNKGIVHIDPDPPTLVHYQQAEEQLNTREKVFIASEHIPARTQNGETVHVHAHVFDETQLLAALNNGADGLVVDLRGNMDDISVLCQDILRNAAGKPVVFAAEVGWEEILRAAMLFCTPGQVTLVSESPDFLASQVETAMDKITLEALQLDLETPEVNVGWIARPGVCELADCSPTVLDARIPEGYSLEDLADIMAEGRLTGNTLTLIGDRIGALKRLVVSGAKQVGVEPDMVSEAKYVIRSIGLEDED